MVDISPTCFNLLGGRELEFKFKLRPAGGHSSASASGQWHWQLSERRAIAARPSSPAALKFRGDARLVRLLRPPPTVAAGTPDQTIVGPNADTGQ